MKFQLKNTIKILQATLILTLTVVGGCTSQTIEERLIDAEAELSQHHYGTAILKLKNILNDTPDNKSALKLLGLAYYQIEAYADAEQKIKQIIGTPVADGQTRLAYADALIQLEQYAAAQDAIKIAPFSDELSARATAIEATALVGLGEFNHAGEIAGKAVSTAPDSPELHVALSKIYLAQGKRFASIRAARQAVNLAPANSRVHDQLGSLLLNEQMFAEAVDAFVDALQTTPIKDAPRSATRTQLKLLKGYLGLGDLDNAKVTLAKLHAAAPEHPAVTYFTALIQFNEKDYERAYQNALATLTKIPNHRPSELMAGITAYRLNNPEQANMYLSSVLADDPSNTAARKLLAATQLKLDNPRGASQTLSTGLEIAPDDISLQEIMTELKNVSQTLGASTYVTQGDELTEDFPAPMENLIASLEGQQSNLFNEELRAIRQMVNTGDTAEAFTRALKLVDSNPDNASLNEFAGIIAQLSNNHIDASEFFLRAIMLEPNAIGSALNLINLHNSVSTLGDAEKILMQALDKSPNSYALLTGLAKIAADKQEISSAITYLQKAIAENPRNPEPRITLIKLYRQQNDADKAAATLTSALAAFPSNPPLRVAAAQQMIVAGELESAVKALQSVLQEAPSSTDALLTIAIALSQLNRPDEAVNAMRQVYQLLPHSYKVTARLISMENQLGNEDEALAIAENYLKVTQDKVGSEVLLGDIKRAGEDYEAASKHYAKAVELQPSELLIVLQTATTRQSGNATQAIDIAQHWLAIHPEYEQLRLELATLQLFDGNYYAAAREYQQLMDQQVETADIYNNLAWVYQQLNDPRALPLAEKGHKQFSDHLMLMDTLGWLIVTENQDLKRAIPLLNNAYQGTLLPSIGFHLAQAYFQEGNRRDSLTTLKALLDSGQNFQERDEAQALKDLIEQP
ncbi:MAG: tetratricopeptide repeat protein [Immundisolibacteraceae bacterium]|nr:tetratricopeptide repeat protein [Immundisolibacteraceae bacterium]